MHRTYGWFLYTYLVLYARLAFITCICVYEKFLFPFPITIFFSPGQISNHFLREFKKFRYRFHLLYGFNKPTEGKLGHIFPTTSQFLISGWSVTIDFFLILSLHKHKLRSLMEKVLWLETVLNFIKDDGANLKFQFFFFWFIDCKSKY